MSAVAERTSVFVERRRRAEALAARHEYAREPLTLLAALLDGQERAFERARTDRPAIDELAPYVVRSALPDVMSAVMSSGTETLREAVLLRFHEGDLEGLVHTWLRGDEQSGTDAFIARAAAAPVLEALPEVAHALKSVDREQLCPVCGGLPQVSVFGETSEALVTSQRRLVCSRCAGEWVYPRMTCVSCGETESAKLVVFADQQQVPYLRLDACETCKRYVANIDLRLEPGAVPLVDEITALPLDIDAAQRGYTKITTNVMGL